LRPILVDQKRTGPASDSLTITAKVTSNGVSVSRAICRNREIDGSLAYEIGHRIKLPRHAVSSKETEEAPAILGRSSHTMEIIRSVRVTGLGARGEPSRMP